ncbi:MAG: hypothetical protein ACLR23_13740 [Clostridia bacterium]
MSLPRSDLVREICRLFGFARTSPAIEEKVMLGVKKAVDLGYVTRWKRQVEWCTGSSGWTGWLRELFYGMVE